MSQVSQKKVLQSYHDGHKKTRGSQGSTERNKSKRPKIYLHSLEPTTDFKSCASEELQGDGLCLLTTVFYIQTNEGAGRKIMRDGMGERQRESEKGERER